MVEDDDALLRSVNHELRTPLNSIVGFSELLLSEVEGPVTDSQRENLEFILRSGRRLLRMFTDLENTRPLSIDTVVAHGHDLLNVLGGVVGFSDLLVTDEVEPLTAQQRVCVDRIRIGSADLRALLAQMVEWARAEAGRIGLARESVSVRQLVTDTLELLAIRDVTGRVRVVQSLAGDLPELQVDRRRVAQALMGLLDHAVRAGETAQGVELRVVRDRMPDTGQPAVRFELIDPTLEIRDDHRLFEVRRPSFAPSGKRIAGMGVGTALARSLIGLHGGSLRVISQPDVGTTFVALLPVRA